MKVGDLVKTNKARIGVPKGTLGVVVSSLSIDCFNVMIFNREKPWMRRWLDIDLEPYNESR
mgnify:CR=1 FL=1|tara:strand:- start:15 stop:197 length:183 start_codon:yes stop_codon:yes gene_type:complete